MLNAQGKFLRAEVGGTGQRVRGAVETVQLAAREMRGEVRGNSAVLRGVCDRVLAAGQGTRYSEITDLEGVTDKRTCSESAIVFLWT